MTQRFSCNVMSDKLLLKLWREISALLYNCTCENTKLLWQRCGKTSHDCNRNLLTMILKDNQMVYSEN